MESIPSRLEIQFQNLLDYINLENLINLLQKLFGICIKVKQK